MFWKKEIPAKQKGAIIGERLSGAVPEWAKITLANLREFDDQQFENSDVWEQFLFESLTFFFHLTRRLIHKELDPSKRKECEEEAFFQMMKPLRAEVRDRFLETTFVPRDNDYAHCKQLVAEAGAPLKGTLVIEFAKAVGGTNPATIMYVATLVLDAVDLVLHKAVKINEVLSGDLSPPGQ